MGSEPDYGDMLPCPFCGYTDTSVEIEKNAMGHIARVSCQICGAEVNGFGVIVPEDGGPADELVASAVKAWNTRSEPRHD